MKLINKHHDEMPDLSILVGAATIAIIFLFLGICFVNTSINFYEGYKEWKAKHEVVADYSNEVYELTANMH